MFVQRSKGDLGSSTFLFLNIALLAKWRCAFFKEREILWGVVIESKYGGWRGFVREEDSPQFSIWWRDLKLSCGSGGMNGWFDRRLKWKIGEGDQAIFWLNNWAGEESLASKIPRLYSLSKQQNECTKNMGHWREGGWVWKFEWTMEMFEWEKS